MAQPLDPAVRTDADPLDPPHRWGVGDAVAGWFIALLSSAIFGSVILAAAGRTGDAAKPENLPIWLVAVLEIPLWLGFIAVPVFSATVRGNGVVRDFWIRIKPLDVPCAIVAGILAQLWLVPVVSWPWLRVLDKSSKDLSKVADQLAGQAHGHGDVLLLTLVVVVGAPIAEELFFRGLLLRSLTDRWGPIVGVVGSSVVFGLSHVSNADALVEVPALIAFGALLAITVLRTRRLGPAVVAHMAFNATAVWSLHIW